MRRLALILIALTTGTLFAQPEIENTWVRVMREKLAPHQALALRDHPASIMVYLTEARKRIAGSEVLRKAPGRFLERGPLRRREPIRSAYGSCGH